MKHYHQVFLLLDFFLYHHIDSSSQILFPLEIKNKWSKWAAIKDVRDAPVRLMNQWLNWFGKDLWLFRVENGIEI